MKIIYGITKSNFGGAQRYVFDLATEAKKAEHDVSVICGAGGVLVEKLREKGIRVIEISGMKRDISLVDEFRSLYFIFRTLFEERPDVFHTNSSKMGGIGNLAARLAGVKKIIFTAHAWAFNEPRPKWQKLPIKFLTWVTILLSHKTICVSEKSKKDMHKWPFIKQKLRVIHNGIAEFNLVPRDNNAFTVGTLSELHQVKGLDILLKAWNKFNKKHHEAKLVIMGEGEERENLEMLVEELGISNSVTFKGYVEKAKQYLSNFDIFVLPSRSENLPYAVLEAGFASLPVIATSVGGVPEIIEPSINGALIQPEDSEALFSTLILLTEDKNLRKRLGENLKQIVLKDFSLEKMVKETLKMYL